MREHEGHGRAKARELLSKSGYSGNGGHFKAADREAKTSGKIGAEIVQAATKHKTKLKHGGLADGGMAPKRLDRGSRKKASTEINITIAPKEGQGAPPIPPGLAAAAAGAMRKPPMPQPPMGVQPNPMAGPPPGAGPMPGGPGMPMAKKGGRQCRALGGRAGPKMTAGAASGEGRLEKEALQRRKGRK